MAWSLGLFTLVDDVDELFAIFAPELLASLAREAFRSDLRRSLDGADAGVIDATRAWLTSPRRADRRLVPPQLIAEGPRALRRRWVDSSHKGALSPSELRRGAALSVADNAAFTGTPSACDVALQVIAEIEHRLFQALPPGRCAPAQSRL
jgi:hypothetical protein